MKTDENTARLITLLFCFAIACNTAFGASKLAQQRARLGKGQAQSAQEDASLDWAAGTYVHSTGKKSISPDSSYAGVQPNTLKKSQTDVLGGSARSPAVRHGAPNRAEHSFDSRGAAEEAGVEAPTKEHKDDAQPPQKSSVSRSDANLNELEQTVKLIQTETNTVDLKSVGDLIINLRRKVTDHPQDPDLRLKLGTYLYIAGDYEGAASELKHALALKPLDLTAHALLGRVLGEAGEREASVLELKRALGIAPGAAVIHYLYARALAERGDLSESINEYRRSIGLKPTAPALSALAESLLSAGDTDGAVKAARKAVSLEPNSAQAHVSLTKALLIAGDPESASRTAREALLLNPGLAESHIALGRTLFAAKKIDAAIDEFKQAVAIDPLSAEARNDLGYALYGRGDVVNAVNEFRLSLKLNPHFTEARNNLEIAIYGVAGIKKKQNIH